jgi:oxalate decarboxylase
MISRRKILTATAAGSVAATAARAASFGNPDEPPQGALNTKGNPASVTDPGPRNPVIGGQFPSAQSPPPTDISDMPLFWASFNNAPKRIQNGGWARQVTQADFAISETIAGVNMRLTAGGIRELHWHLAAEWAYIRSSYYADISLSGWLTHAPPAMVAQHLNVDEATIAKFPRNSPAVMPE